MFKGRYRLRFMKPQLLEDRTDPPPLSSPTSEYRLPGHYPFLSLNLSYIIIIHCTKLHRTEI